MRRVGATVALVGLGIVLPLACRQPTQMTIDVRLFGDLPCAAVGPIAIIVRKDRDAAERGLQTESYSTEISADCSRGTDIGTLVITPEGSSGAVVVAARITGEGRCEPPLYKGCIISRRAFEFIDHRPLFLPISLEARCIDVPCDAATSCRAAQCLASDVTCQDDGSCVSEAEPKSDGDGGSVLPDGSVNTDPPPPLGEGGTDASNDGSSPEDAGSDGPADTGVDAPFSGDGTNTCFTQPVNSDCATTGMGCCDPPAHEPMCTDPGMCKGAGYNFYACTGRKHCGPNQLCCADPPNVGTAIRSRCADDCPEMTNSTLCNEDIDCPPLRKCMGTYVPIGGSSRKMCVIP